MKQTTIKHNQLIRIRHQTELYQMRHKLLISQTKQVMELEIIKMRHLKMNQKQIKMNHQMKSLMNSKIKQ